MRSLLIFLSLLAASFSPFAAAQDYPNRPVTLIVTYTPGGGADTTGHQLRIA